MKARKLFRTFTIPALLLLLAAPVLGADDGGEILYASPIAGVVFSHQVHVDDAGFDCDSCHEELFAYEARAAEQQPDFNMKALYEGQYCGACHDGNTAFASDTRCTSCHIGVLGYNRARGIETAAGHH